MISKIEVSSLFNLFKDGIKRKSTYDDGIKFFMDLRREIWDIYTYIFQTTSLDHYFKKPLTKDKTIAYYLYHLTRIEDITSNTLIAGKPQIFFLGDYQNRLGVNIITTGNELLKNDLIMFSERINIEELKKYVYEVYNNTNSIVKELSFIESRTKVSPERKASLLDLHCVSADPSAFWLVDYWCNKNYQGLMLMPFTRHQLLHIEGILRIKAKLEKKG